MYDSQSGESRGGSCSPTLGAIFASMALNIPVQIESRSGQPRDNTTDGSNSADGSSNNIRAIAGGVVGGLVAFALIILAILLWRHRQKKRKEEKALATKAKSYDCYIITSLPRGKDTPAVTQADVPQRSAGKRNRHRTAPTQPPPTQPSSVMPTEPSTSLCMAGEAIS